MEWIERYTLDILRCEFEIGNLIRPVNTPSISNLWNHEIRQANLLSFHVRYALSLFCDRSQKKLEA